MQPSGTVEQADTKTIGDQSGATTRTMYHGNRRDERSTLRTSALEIRRTETEDVQIRHAERTHQSRGRFWERTVALTTRNRGELRNDL